MLKAKASINNNAIGEYGMIYDNKDGTFDIYHMNKNLAALSQFVRDRLEITTTAFNPNTYYANNNPNYQANVGIVLMLPEIRVDTNPNKWLAETWMDAIIDTTPMLIGVQTDPPRQDSYGNGRWPMLNVDSFMRFMLQAYPTDAARWDMQDNNLAILKRACMITRM